MNDEQLNEALSSANDDDVRGQLHRRIIASATTELNTIPVTYSLDRHHRQHGPDIKKQARTATPRILACSMAYRLTRDTRFLNRAVAEMISLASFPNWHPTLFLGTSEIATAVSIGYDWLYNDMIQSDRDTISHALYRHCLSMGPAVYRMIFDDSDSPQLTSLVNAAIERIGGEANVYLQCGDGGVGVNEFARNVPWVTKHNNWNQVCNCGMLAAALAIGDIENDLGRLVTVGVLKSLPLAMKGSYFPDGCYGEGPQYWSHGTMCNVLAIAMLQSSLGTDYGLSKQPGFSNTLSYRMSVRGPTGLSFNYADASADLFHEACITWLARSFPSPMGVVGMKYSRVGLVEMLNYLDDIDAKGGKKGGRKEIDRTLTADRFLTFHAVWFPDNVSDTISNADELLDSRYNGGAQIAIFRSCWNDRRALWGAIKGGTNDQTHCHLDLGSFCIDALGCRWAMDLGKDDYGLWKYHSHLQKSPRWNNYMRTNNWGHNTISVNGFSDGSSTTPVKYVLQDITAEAPIIGFKSTPTWSHAIIDLSHVYPFHRIKHKNKEVKEDKLMKASRSITRGLAMIDRSVLVVQDEIVLTDSSNGKFSHLTDIIWRMYTSTTITLLTPTVAMLENGTERLKVEILTPSGLKFFTSIADPRVLFPDICTNPKKNDDSSDDDNSDDDNNKNNDDKKEQKKLERKRLRRLAKGKVDKEQQGGTEESDQVKPGKKVIEQDPNEGVSLLGIECLDCLSSNIFQSGKKGVTAEFRLCVLFTPIPSEYKDSILKYNHSNNVVIGPLHTW